MESRAKDKKDTKMIRISIITNSIRVIPLVFPYFLDVLQVFARTIDNSYGGLHFALAKQRVIPRFYIKYDGRGGREWLDAPETMP